MSERSRAEAPRRREYSAADQAEIQETAVLRMWRERGMHVRAYEINGAMRFERVAEVVAIGGAS